MTTFTGASLSTINSILKDDYKGPVREMLNSKTLLLHRIEATSEYTVGRRAYYPLHKGRNEGLGARPEADNTTASDLPIAGSQEYDDATYKVAHLYGSAQFTGPSVAASSSDEGAFARTFESELDGLVRDASRDINRQLFGPKNGALATVLTVPSGTSVDGGSIGAQQFEVADRRHIRKNMRIDIIETAATGTLGTVNGDSLVVTSVSKLAARPNGGLVTVTGTLSNVNVGDLICREDNFGNEIFGLEDLLSDANPLHIVAGADVTRRFVGALDRGSEEFWQTNIINHANAEFTDTLFQDAIDLVDIEGDGDISLFLTDHTIFNAYGNSLTPDRRYNTMGSRFAMLDGGFKSLDYDEVPVAKDRDCQYNTIWALAEDRMKFLHMSDWDWMQSDGSVLSRIGKKDAYEATLYKYCEFGICDAKDHVQIKNVGAVV